MLEPLFRRLEGAMRILASLWRGPPPTTQDGAGEKERPARLLFFDVRVGGQIYRDEKGAPVEDFGEARAQAIAAAREIIVEQMRKGNDMVADEIIIRDIEGRELGRINLHDLPDMA